ncbi:MAG: hypothetical protein ACXW27_09085 [Allosphingosinicella sp.]
MKMPRIVLNIGVRWRWWAKPVRALALTAAHFGVPLPYDALARWIVDKGAIVYSERVG